ncbi:hypothetical protein RMATCC62417_11577 [Rhizopus microsporus]|nr:hypothetical protein RMATCC62417_11577 [Rhizopus microsporus]
MNFREEGISMLTGATSPAGRQVHRLIHLPGDDSLPEETVAHHGHDEHINDSTESPNDDTLSDGIPINSPWSISSPSARLSVSLLAPGQGRFLLIMLTSRVSFIKCNNTSLDWWVQATWPWNRMCILFCNIFRQSKITMRLCVSLLGIK